MVKVKGGRSIYGHALGVIAFETKLPRIPGDAANATTYDFPVRLKVIKKLSDLVENGRKDPRMLKETIEAMRELESEGVRAITTTAGFYIIFQKEMANAVNIPVFSSSLLQIPVAMQILKEGQKLAIITANSKVLTHDFLREAGIDPIFLPSIVIAGFRNEPWFLSAIGGNLDTEEAEESIVGMVKQLISKHHKIGAIMLECHNLPPYSAAIQEATGLPVFDAQTLAKMAYNVVMQKRYIGFM